MEPGDPARGPLILIFSYLFLSFLICLPTSDMYRFFCLPVGEKVGHETVSATDNAPNLDNKLARLLKLEGGFDATLSVGSNFSFYLPRDVECCPQAENGRIVCMRMELVVTSSCRGWSKAPACRQTERSRHSARIWTDPSRIDPHAS